MKRSVRIYPTKTELVRGAADLIVASADRAVRERGRFSLVLSGGSTPRDLYGLLAAQEYRQRIPWEHVHLFWGDERTVPPEHPESNYGMAKAALLSHVPIPPENIHRMRGEIAPAAAAREYREEIGRFFGEGKARFDLILLGMGSDGHTASLFPGSAALDEPTEPVVAGFAPSLGAWRITLTIPMINAAWRVVFLVAGQDKAAMLARVLNAPEATKKRPATLVGPHDGELFWLLDADAAAGRGNETASDNSEGGRSPRRR